MRGTSGTSGTSPLYIILVILPRTTLPATVNVYTQSGFTIYGTFLLLIAFSKRLLVCNFRPEVAMVTKWVLAIEEFSIRIEKAYRLDIDTHRPIQNRSLKRSDCPDIIFLIVILVRVIRLWLARLDATKLDALFWLYIAVITIAMRVLGNIYHKE